MLTQLIHRFLEKGVLLKVLYFPKKVLPGTLSDRRTFCCRVQLCWRDSRRTRKGSTSFKSAHEEFLISQIFSAA